MHYGREKNSIYSLAILWRLRHARCHVNARSLETPEGRVSREENKQGDQVSMQQVRQIVWLQTKPEVSHTTIQQENSQSHSPRQQARREVKIEAGFVIDMCVRTNRGMSAHRVG